LKNGISNPPLNKVQALTILIQLCIVIQDGQKYYFFSRTKFRNRFDVRFQCSCEFRRGE